MPRPGPALLLRSSEVMLPAAPNDPPEVLSDASLIVSRWQQLTSIDRQSPDFPPLLSSLTADGNRSSTTGLCGEDARVTLNMIDEVRSVFAGKATTYATRPAQVLRDGKIPGEYERDTLCTIRTLAYNSGQVPPRYQVDRRSLSMEKHTIIGNGAFADVRKGRLCGKIVAVRTLRIDQKTDFDEAQKVCVASN